MTMKKVTGVYAAPPQHWVGDGFPVRSLMSYQDKQKAVSPFLLLDYAGPMNFEPTDRPRGVGEHPHRGFETVTIVYDGEVSHRDSTGAGGTIGPGDVQWMTAASGILHEEFHSPAFSRKGGVLEMVQLWVNLPARHKLAPPRYQQLQRQAIPEVPLPDNAGRVRVIAGGYQGQRGAADTFTPVDVWDVQIKSGHRAGFTVPENHTLIVVILKGNVTLNGTAAAEAELVVLERENDAFAIEAERDTRLLVLGGEPIDEPVVGQGPFVMNSEAEIHQAIRDFSSGRFGRIASHES